LKRTGSYPDVNKEHSANYSTPLYLLFTVLADWSSYFHWNTSAWFKWLSRIPPSNH